MTLLQRFPLLLFQPDYATSDLYDSPPLKDAFIMVCLYAVISSLKTLVGVIITTDSIRFALFTFFGSVALVFITWIFLTFFFHFVADMLGATGELHNAVTFVGLAAAPNVVVSVLSLLIMIVNMVFFPDQPHEMLQMGDFGLSMLGMVWGWPGMLCYFGLKNAQRLSSIKSLLVVMPVFFGFALLEITQSNYLKIIIPN
ncbi:MAG: YIP1 family protein [Ignavibacteriae bacterium]|nr:YIP1 family protein [Ignavibacteriota bacterium]